MPDMARRGALRLISASGLGSLFSLVAPKQTAGALSIGAGSQECEVASPSRSDQFWRIDRARGLKVYHPDCPNEIPAFVAPLKSVKPWAKILIARHYEDNRRSFVQQLEKRIYG